MSMNNDHLTDKEWLEQDQINRIKNGDFPAYNRKYWLQVQQHFLEKQKARQQNKLKFISKKRNMS
jgi:hypothetical protein